MDESAKKVSLLVARAERVGVLKERERVVQLLVRVLDEVDVDE